MEAMTVFLNAYIAPVGTQIGLRGMGDFVPINGFTIPQNSVHNDPNNGHGRYGFAPA